MNFCDLHCDTPLELYKKNEVFEKNSLHISLEKAKELERYIQCAAVWSDRRLRDEECFDAFLSAAGYFRRQAGEMLAETGNALREKKRAFVLTVEDARLLCGRLDRLQTLYGCGVRILTLVWKNESIIGGAWNTDTGLTDFGKECVEKAFEIGIIPDVSHASRRTVREVAQIATNRGKPFIASHSNAYAVCRNARNLDSEGLYCVASSGGIVGVSLYPHHLTDSDKCSIEDVMRHISYYVNACGSDSVAFGCDFDGIDKTPDKISDISDIPYFYDITAKKLGSLAADKIFFDNAYNFLISNI